MGQPQNNHGTTAKQSRGTIVLLDPGLRARAVDTASFLGGFCGHGCGSVCLPLPSVVRRCWPGRLAFDLDAAEPKHGRAGHHMERRPLVLKVHKRPGCRARET